MQDKAWLIGYTAAPVIDVTRLRVEAPANYKDPAKIEEYRNQKFEALRKSSAFFFNPLVSRINTLSHADVYLATPTDIAPDQIPATIAYLIRSASSSNSKIYCFAPDLMLRAIACGMDGMNYEVIRAIEDREYCDSIFIDPIRAMLRGTTATQYESSTVRLSAMCDLMRLQNCAKALSAVDARSSVDIPPLVSAEAQLQDLSAYIRRRFE